MILITFLGGVAIVTFNFSTHNYYQCCSTFVATCGMIIGVCLDFTSSKKTHYCYSNLCNYCKILIPVKVNQNIFCWVIRQPSSSLIFWPISSLMLSLSPPSSPWTASNIDPDPIIAVTNSGCNGVRVTTHLYVPLSIEELRGENTNCLIKLALFSLIWFGIRSDTATDTSECYIIFGPHACHCHITVCDPSLKINCTVQSHIVASISNGSTSGEINIDIRRWDYKIQTESLK